MVAQGTISGTVFSNKLALPFANVNSVGTYKGTLTNSNGEFSINNIAAGDTLRFSLLGYQTIDTIIQQNTKTISIDLEESPIIVPEIVVTAKIALSIIRKVGENLTKNYPTIPTAFKAIFRKQVVENNDYCFLGNSQLSILCPTYINENKEQAITAYLNDVNLSENKREDISFKISSSNLISFYPNYGFIRSPQFFDFSFNHSFSDKGETYIKIDFKTKDEYWDDSPTKGSITIEKPSYAITELAYHTSIKTESKRGYNKEKKVYKATFITNDYLSHTFYKKVGNKWYFNYSRIVWDVDVAYKKYPNDNTNFVLQSDLFAGEEIDPSSIKEKAINTNNDLFNKQKKGSSPVNWSELNPILPDYFTQKK